MNQYSTFKRFHKYVWENLSFKPFFCKTILAHPPDRANFDPPEKLKTDMFKTIALITNYEADEVKDTLQIVSKFLIDRNIEVILDEYCLNLLPDSDLRVVSSQDLPVECDLAIAIGGDGIHARLAHAVEGGVFVGLQGFRRDSTDHGLEYVQRFRQFWIVKHVHQFQ